MEWNVFVVNTPQGLTCYLVPLSHAIVFRNGLPPEAIAGEQRELPGQAIGGGPGGIDYDLFKPNAAFARFLHEVLARHVLRCPGVLKEAARRNGGYVYVIDGRTPSPAREVPSEDIIGAVQVEHGNPIAYLPSPAYEPFGRNGLMVLDAWLEARYMEELLERVR